MFRDDIGLIRRWMCYRIHRARCEAPLSGMAAGPERRWRTRRRGYSLFRCSRFCGAVLASGVRSRGLYYCDFVAAKDDVSGKCCLVDGGDAALPKAQRAVGPWNRSASQCPSLINFHPCRRPDLARAHGPGDQGCVHANQYQMIALGVAKGSSGERNQQGKMKVRWYVFVKDEMTGHPCQLALTLIRAGGDGPTVQFGASLLLITQYTKRYLDLIRPWRVGRKDGLEAIRRKGKFSHPATRKPSLLLPFYYLRYASPRLPSHIRDYANAHTTVCTYIHGPQIPNLTCGRADSRPEGHEA